MVACGGMRNGYARGGTTIGNTWMYGRLGGRARLRHESRHATQWAIFGYRFPAAYGLAQVAARGRSQGNIFERWAGLREGGYAMSRRYGRSYSANRYRAF